MRYILLILITVGCNGGISNSEAANIKVFLNLHNINTNTKFTMDSIDAATKYEISLLKYKFSKDTVASFINAHMAVFRNEWNHPYDIKRDRNITYEKYLEYCKAHNLDPETYYKFLD